MKRSDKKKAIRRLVPGLSAVAALGAFWVAAGAPILGMI